MNLCYSQMLWHNHQPQHQRYWPCPSLTQDPLPPHSACPPETGISRNPSALAHQWLASHATPQWWASHTTPQWWASHATPQCLPSSDWYLTPPLSDCPRVTVISRHPSYTGCVGTSQCFPTSDWHVMPLLSVILYVPSEGTKSPDKFPSNSWENPWSKLLDWQSHSHCLFLQSRMFFSQSLCVKQTIHMGFDDMPSLIHIHSPKLQKKFKCCTLLQEHLSLIL